ncbi:MAG: 5-formyltetrahydrofolate cyclo-ligase [Oscillospiraceae bacterium]|jgi:5-formyltetrahydrofolate cyclo-ligase|nr:5-formyltetrahydrofolate cyclo-ligase [Oscillospiraceae bacterium]
MENGKAAFREKTAKAIAALDAEYLAESDAGIFIQIIALPEFIAAKTVLLYYSVGREPDTHRLIEHALAQGKTVALPVSLPNGVMEARVIGTLDGLSKRALGIPAPADGAALLLPEALDFIAVPAMTFDRAGYRMGRGGGYYDRYLPKTGAFTAGLARERLVAGKIPREPHDFPVRRLVTEKGPVRL